MARRGVRQSGFSLIELMIVVAIIGILASVAIPNYKRFQFKAKSAEGKLNLAALRTAQESYYSEYGVYVPATADPVAIPGTTQTDFDPANPGFNEVGWKPEGRVFFSYGVGVTDDRTGYSADAGADLDANGIYQFWAYVKENPVGVRAEAVVGCPVALVQADAVEPCTPQSGQSVF